MVVRYLFSVLLACVLLHPLNAQPNLLFKRIEVTYPTIRLAFKVTCDGAFRNDLQPQDFEVYENGLKVKDATIWCPPEVDCCVSVSLVFDRSGSMVGEKIENVKKGGIAFVNSMNPDGLPCDEAAVVSFSHGDDVVLDLPMTTKKPDLLGAIDSMKANGLTALWDASAMGIDELVRNGTNRCKAVIILSDGGDNNSQIYKKVEEVIQHALLNNVKVYTIGYGIQNAEHAQDLQNFAFATGGQYYFSADGSDLAQIYASIKQSIKDAYQECLITYEAGCPDGTQRTVELVLKNYCGGTVARTRTYMAPLDRSQFQDVHIDIGEDDVGATKDVVVPVTLETPVNAVFSKASIAIGYDYNVLNFRSISTAGTLLEGKALIANEAGSRVNVSLKEHVEMNTAGGVLFYLHFTAGDVARATTTPVYMINWTFDAYCLNPQMSNGFVRIRPREPELNCEITAPDALNWNDQEKRYEPNPFNVEVRVNNTGTKEAFGVRATLVTDPAIVTLVTPQIPVQDLSPNLIYPGGTGYANWTLQVKEIEDLDSIPIYFSITADNNPTQACWKRIVVDPALSSALACDIQSVDTVFFREQYYEPVEFDVHVTAHNVGSGQTKDVRAQLLQDTRFTIVPPASKQLADVLLSQESASDSFRVKMHPRDTDGYDTLRVNIQGDDTNPAWCEWPVYVQRVRMPEFSLLCTTVDDSLEFNEATYEYEPNPFVVRTLAENIGETYAEDCQLIFVGPSRFEPVAGSNPRDAGTMQIGDRHEENWLIRALDRNIGGWDTLVFQVQGRGGLDRPIVLTECRLPIYVPPIRKPEYTMSCSLIDSLVYENNQYSPDPIEFSLRITNTGNALGRGLHPTIVPPPSVSLAAGEDAQKYVPALATNESRIVTWRLHPESRGNDGVYRVCAQVVDSVGISAQCCQDIFIPRTENPDLKLTCWSIDTLYLDASSGQYLGNPFDVTLDVNNIGLGTAENVRASIAVLGSFIRILGDVEQNLGDISNELSSRVNWQVEALRREEPADVPIVLTVVADNHPPVECNLVVHIPATQTPVLESVCSSIPEDSLFFDWSTGRFEYTECTLTYTITNTGAADAQNVRALLILPSGVILSAGEETQKTLSPSLLHPGESGTVTWRFSAKRADDDMMRSFRFIARADNAEDAECIDDLFIQGSPRHLTLQLPSYTLLRYSEKRDIPIRIDSTIGKDLSEYVLHLYYDPTVISLLSVSNAGTLTNIGWVGARMQEVEKGHVQISDYTTGTPLGTTEGVLLNLKVEGIYNDHRDLASFGESVLDLDEENVLLNRGAITPHTVDGRVIVTNECLEPLVATERYVLEQNRPNPFNPETVISFNIPKEDHVRLAVFDRHGREITVLRNRIMSAGRHSVHFTADNLPSGVYFYRLEYGGSFDVRKMILSR
ncbi:VWA domain-containing protein [bacterium]|nr:VWA domain-containing protein [bacterium]